MIEKRGEEWKKFVWYGNIRKDGKQKTRSALLYFFLGIYTLLITWNPNLVSLCTLRYYFSLLLLVVLVVFINVQRADRRGLRSYHLPGVIKGRAELFFFVVSGNGHLYLIVAGIFGVIGDLVNQRGARIGSHCSVHLPFATACRGWLSAFPL